MSSCESKPLISWKPVNTDIYLVGSIVVHHLYTNTVQYIKWICMYVLWLNAPDQGSGLVSEMALSTTQLCPIYFILKRRTGQAKAW